MEEGISCGAAEPLRILIAEDEPSHARLLSLALRKHGHASDLVGDGEALLRAVQRERYDAILMDLRMPRMGGLEAAAWIRQNHAEGDRPFLIAVTAETDAHSPEWLRQGGFDAHFAKPFQTGALLATVGKVRRRPAPLPA